MRRYSFLTIPSQTIPSQTISRQASLRQPHRHSCFSILLSLVVIGLSLFGPSWGYAGDHTGYLTQFYQAGVKSYRQGDTSGAVNYFRRVVAADPKNANARYYLAISLDKLDQDTDALLQYQHVVDLGADPKVVSYARSRMNALRQSPVIASTAGITSDLNVIRNHSPKVTVPLRNNRNALMVDAVLVDDRTHAQATGTFIIDTGATYTSISEDMAEILGLDLARAEKIRITTANGRIEVPKVTIDRLNVNGLEARNIEATVIPIRHDSNFSGLLGLSFIRQFVLTIDPASGQLIFQQN